MVPGPAANVENTANNPGGPVGSILAEQEVDFRVKEKAVGVQGMIERLEFIVSGLSSSLPTGLRRMLWRSRGPEHFFASDFPGPGALLRHALGAGLLALGAGRRLSLLRDSASTLFERGRLPGGSLVLVLAQAQRFRSLKSRCRPASIRKTPRNRQRIKWLHRLYRSPFGERTPEDDDNDVSLLPFGPVAGPAAARLPVRHSLAMIVNLYSNEKYIRKYWRNR
jgi:hypothetical protein